MVIHLGPIIYMMLAMQIVVGIFCVVLMSVGIGWLKKILKQRQKRVERHPLRYYRLKPAG